MSLIKKVRDYILDDEFKITVLKNSINVINYDSIGQIDNTKVIIKYNDGLLKITGQKLVVSKLLQDEVLITGIIKSIELG